MGIRQDIGMQKEPHTPPHEKEAPKAEDGERIDPPKPADDGAIRGAREDLDIAHELEEEAKSGEA
jgi:hypothetical protein